MQFEDTKFRRNNVIALSFRKPFSQEADKVAESSERPFNEWFDLDFNNVF